jgi:hypothetical protein
MKKLSIVAVIASSFLLLASPALADETAPAKASAAAKENKTEKGYGYAFEDDPLNSGVSGTTGFVLKVRPKGARTALLRPRASFVPELLKSVESL